MSTFLKITSISELHNFFGCKKPFHPLLSVVNLAEISVPREALGKKLTTPFFSISLKTKVGEPFKYGRKYFDFSEGVLLGIAPNQVLEISESSKRGDLEGWALYFHPDLIRGYGLMDSIVEYGFFSYETNEALHLSEKEKGTLNEIVRNISEECQAPIDDFSQDVLVTTIELLINYTKRFYGRQFITRKSEHTDIVSQFQGLLKRYFDAALVEGLPQVRYFAAQLHLSDSYLSDVLKKETGKNAQETIHYFVIDKAKTLLLNTDKTIAEIAFELGFEYPQYFSRLFKGKAGVTPKAYRSGLG